MTPASIPPPLRRGDRVAVVAPSGPVPRDRFAPGLAILRERYDVVWNERIFEREGYLAGSDDARADELNQQLGCPDCKAIFAARGGYGVTRILERLDARALRRHPKPIVGFSDITALHWWSFGFARVRSVHGPNVTTLPDLTEPERQWLWDLLESPQRQQTLPARLTPLVPSEGAVTGQLVGGNLEVTTRLLGTPFLNIPETALWMLEDIGERPYRIDRSLTHLRTSGALRTARAFLFGEMTDCEEKDGAGPSSRDVLAERALAFRLPAYAGAPFGHGKRNWAWPFGAPARIDDGRLSFGA